MRNAAGNDGYEYLGSLVYKRTGANSLELESSSFGGGRIMKTSSVYDPHYFITDHLGSVRVMWDGSNTERSDYYPFGGRWTSAETQATTNRFLYNGKELQTTGGVNYLDYGARMYDARIGRWHSIDPLADIRVNLSPFVYCSNNPINRIDPTGMLDDDIYYNELGKEIYRLKNDKPDRNFVIKTSKTTNQLYPFNISKERGFSSPISKETATLTETEITGGNLSGDHMKNVIQIENTETIRNMMDVIKDDGLGGIGGVNNREYGGFLNGGKVTAAKPGPIVDITKKNAGKASISGDVDFHSHPSGSVKVAGGIAQWQQGPSKTDINTAIGRDYVFGMRLGVIYIYDKGGVRATIPMSTFK